MEGKIAGKVCKKTPKFVARRHLFDSAAHQQRFVEQQFPKQQASIASLGQEYALKEET